MIGYGRSWVQDELSRLGIECILSLAMYESSDTQVDVDNTFMFFCLLIGQMRQQSIENT